MHFEHTKKVLQINRADEVIQEKLPVAERTDFGTKADCLQKTFQKLGIQSKIMQIYTKYQDGLCTHLSKN